MNTILRASAVYTALLFIFRVTGKRSLAQITAFDFVLLLIISETTQQAMTGDDYSVTNSVLAITTLIVLDVGLSRLTQRWKRLDRWLDGLPLVLVEDGTPLHDRMKKARVTAADILAAARTSQGLARMDQIRYAVLERSGEISIIPKDGEG